VSDWFENGAPAATIPVDDRAVQYGDGVFETIAIRSGRPRYWGLHMARLADACRRLSLALPATSILERDFDRALTRTTVNIGFATAKIIVTAGVGQRGYARSRGAPVRALIGIFPNRPLDATLYADGVSVRLCDTPLATQPRTAGVKTLNRLDQVLAREEWRDPGIFEGLMCDADGRLVCGTMSNLFAVRDAQVATPRLSRAGVAGIMRRRIIDLLAANGIDCDERDMPKDELDDMHELFICNSQFGVLPVRRCGVRRFAVGEVTRSVMAMLADKEVPECRT
jgi:4-amino-4-deoxychorismate lyase